MGKMKKRRRKRRGVLIQEAGGEKQRMIALYGEGKWKKSPEPLLASLSF